MAFLPRRSRFAAIAATALTIAALPASPLTPSSAVAMPLAQPAILHDAAPSALLRVKWVKPLCTYVCVLWTHTFGMPGKQCHIWKKVCGEPDPTHPRYMDFPPELPPLPGESHSRASDQQSTKAPDPLQRGLLEREAGLPTPTVGPRSRNFSTPGSGPRPR